MLFAESNSSQFITVKDAARVTVEGMPGDGTSWGIIDFLMHSGLDEFLIEPHISGSVTTAPLSRSQHQAVGESPLSQNISGAFTHDLRFRYPVPPSIINSSNRMPGLVTANPAVSFTHGLVDLTDRKLFPTSDVPTWFSTIMGLGSNIDVTFTVAHGDPTTAMHEFFHRLCQHHRNPNIFTRGNAIAIVHQGAVDYVHIESRYDVYGRGWNFFFWPPGHNDRWVTGTSSRCHQHLPIVVQNDQLGFVPDPAFYRQPGRLQRSVNDLGDFAAELAKELRRTATHPGRVTDIRSYQERLPIDPSVSYAHATIAMLNLFVADFYAHLFAITPNLVPETLDQLGLKRHFGHNSVEQVRVSLASAADQLYLPPNEARYPDYYPNSVIRSLPALAPYLAPWLMLPMDSYLQLGDQAGRDYYVLATGHNVASHT